MMEQAAKNINMLGRFCGKSDIEALTADRLQDQYGLKRADVMVLFGGSIISGGDVLAEAIKNGIAENYVIVGGAGHTTDALRRRVHEECPSIMTDGLPEAEIFDRYLEVRYGLKAEYHSVSGRYHAAKDGCRASQVHFRRCDRYQFRGL